MMMTYATEIEKMLEQHDKGIRGKAIDEFLHMLESHMENVGKIHLQDIRMIAEKLKE